MEAALLFVIHATLKIYEDSMIQTQRYNFFHHWFWNSDKYSHEIPQEYLSTLLFRKNYFFRRYCFIYKLMFSKSSFEQDYRKAWKILVYGGVTKNSSNGIDIGTYSLLFLIAIYSHKNDQASLWNEKLAPEQSLYYNRSISWLGTHFNDRPKMLTYR